MPHQCSIHIEVTKQLLHSPYMIQLKHKTPVAFFYISYFLLANLLKSHIWFTTPKNKTRVHPRHDSKNSDDTPLWIQNDRAHPTHLIWSTFMKNSLQNRDFWKKYFLRRLFTVPVKKTIDFLFKNIDFNNDIFIYPLSKSQHRWISTVENRLSMWAQSCITYSTSMPSIPRQRHSVSCNRSRSVKSKERKLQKGGG